MIITKNTPFTKEEILDKNKIALSSMAMDLKRAALGYYRGSAVMADKFFNEALKRKKEIDVFSVRPCIKNLLNNLDKIKKESEKRKLAEDALMYGTLFQNAALAK